MNTPEPSLSPREAIEVRLTALLLGELTGDEAAEVRAQMAADSQLAALYLRLSQAIELLREANALPQSPAPQETPRLSGERRERLLAHFKHSAPLAAVVRPKREWMSVVPAGIAAAIIALVGWSMLFSVTLLKTSVEPPDFSAEGGELTPNEMNVAVPSATATLNALPPPIAPASIADLDTDSSNLTLNARGYAAYSPSELTKSGAGRMTTRAPAATPAPAAAMPAVKALAMSKAPARPTPTQATSGTVTAGDALERNSGQIVLNGSGTFTDLNSPLISSSAPGTGTAMIGKDLKDANGRPAVRLAEEAAGFAKLNEASISAGAAGSTSTLVPATPPAMPFADLGEITADTSKTITLGGTATSSPSLNGSGEDPRIASHWAEMESTKAELAENKAMVEALNRSKIAAEEKLSEASKEIERYRAGVTKMDSAADSPETKALAGTAVDALSLNGGVTYAGRVTNSGSGSVNIRGQAAAGGWASQPGMISVPKAGEKAKAAANAPLFNYDAAGSRTKRLYANAPAEPNPQAKAEGTVTFTGTISGGQAASASNSYSGGTTITSGGFILNGTNTSAAPTINAITTVPSERQAKEGLGEWKFNETSQDPRTFNNVGGLESAVGQAAADGSKGGVFTPANPLAWFSNPARFGGAGVSEKPQAAAPSPNQAKKDAPDDYAGSFWDQPRAMSKNAEGQKQLSEGQNYFQSGRYDLALKRSEQILSLDPSNPEARKLKEEVSKTIDNYGLAANDETRSRAVRDVDTAWANPIRRFDIGTGSPLVADPPKRTDYLNRKLERIIIPKLEFRDATVSEALDFLKKKSVDLDTAEPNAANRGINIVTKLGDAAGVPATAAPAGVSVNPADARITVSLTNIPMSEALRYVTNLAGLKYKIEPYAVTIVPQSVATETVVTREYKAGPEVFAALKAAGSGDKTKGGTEAANRAAAKEALIAQGMTFGPNASAIYIPSSGKLIVRNTQEQLDLAEAIVSAAEEGVQKEKAKREEDAAVQTKQAQASVPQPEVATRENAFSTFSLNVTDVAFKLAAASLEQGRMPDEGTVRSEEFLNAFNYCDPEPVDGTPMAFAYERARYPFAQNRDLLRLSLKTAAVGRQAGRPLNLVLLLDNSGSMERADRVSVLHEALRVLCAQLQPQDKLSVVTFARTARLWADGVPGNKAGEVTARAGEITPQGGTNLEAALDLGYETARRHYQVGSVNRVVLLTDGAANLGNVDPEALQKKVEAQRKQGVALDCFGIGWEGFGDTLLEALSRHGDGRYGFINTPEEAASEFAGQLAGALRVAASDVKVQVEFNPRRVTAYRQIGYAKHQLTKEQFRDNTVDAAEIGAAESGNALYVVEVNPRGEGDLGTVRVRFKVPGTTDYREQEWNVPFVPAVPALEQASPALRLAGAAAAFSEWLVRSPYATEVTPDRLLGLMNGVPAVYGADPRPQKLEWMIRQAKSVSGR